MSADRCVCTTCGASHRKRAPKDDTRRSTASDSDLDVTHCRDCSAAVLKGRIDGLERRLDPHPLNELGLATYKPVRPVFIRKRLATRATSVNWTTERWPPTPGAQLLTIHVCHSPIPDLFIEKGMQRNARSIEFPDNPTF